MGNLMRKEGVITTPFTKIKPIFIYMLLFLTFLVTDIFGVRSSFLITIDMATSMMETALPMTMPVFIIFMLVNAVISVALLELYLTVYYFFGFQSMRGFMPFSVKEFKANTRPFFIIRNLIWGGLSALMWLPGGYFIGIGSMIFEIAATMIVIIPVFFFMKKHYVKDGYAGKILNSFILPFLVYNGVMLFYSLV